ncbi:MAG: hypothetical protein ACTH8P_13905 [Ewingella sp.]|uniref:hypothetical protein n=1 Tax=Ewingella TaxID=41201 RepID=UPI0033654E1D
MPNPYNYGMPNNNYIYRPPEPPAHPQNYIYQQPALPNNQQIYQQPNNGNWGPMPAAPRPGNVPLPPVHVPMPPPPINSLYASTSNHRQYDYVPMPPPPHPKIIPLPAYEPPRQNNLHPLAQQEVRRNPLPSTSRPPAAPPAQSSSRPRANTLAATPPKFDVRGNDVAATQRESRWAVHLWSNMSSSQTSLLVNHMHQMIGTLRSCESRFSEFTAGMDKATVADLHRGLRKAGELERELKDWSRSGESSAVLANRLQGSIKQTIDVLGSAMNYYKPAVSQQIRSQSVFTDRGRQKIRSDQVRSSSRENRHAGIVDTLNRRPSTENFFPQRINHAKSSNERIPTSDTAKRFKVSGTPFIAGASGTGQFVIQHLEMSKPFAQCSSQEKQSREKILIMYAALMTLSGHHSVMETLMIGRKLGYLADLPDPLQGPGGYDKCMKALDSRLRSMGMDANVRLRA